MTSPAGISKMHLYGPGDTRRDRNEDESEPSWRTPFWRDYARLVHSAAFRRLAGKTQLFPGKESDFFRNRLSHSLEVAQIAKSIALRINTDFLGGANGNLQINTDLVEFAALAHDLGHPPFGHNGEAALDECMKNVGGFEGNAQTLRVLARLEKKVTTTTSSTGIAHGRDERLGLNLAYRSLAAILKYDRMIPRRRRRSGPVLNPQKGYYFLEDDLVKRIRESVVGRSTAVLKTTECGVMDLADDIAYSTYDLEDCFKVGFLTPLAMLAEDDSLLPRVAQKVKRDIGFAGSLEDLIPRILHELDFVFDGIVGSPKRLSSVAETMTAGAAPAKSDESRLYTAERMARSWAAEALAVSEATCALGYERTRFTSWLVNDAIQGVEFALNRESPALSVVCFPERLSLRISILKHYVYEAIISSPRLQIVEGRGFDIVKQIFDRLSDDGACTERGARFLPPDFREQFDAFAGNTTLQKRVVCDFIAGMTDRYAVEFHQRLFSVNAETLFKTF